MAQYTPEGWKASAEAQRTFAEEYPTIKKFVASRVRRYFGLAAIGPNDLLQEGLIAALYAIDSYQPKRGKRAAYIGVVVDNALAMIAAESRAQCRQPYTFVMDEDDKGETIWRRVPVSEPVDPEMVEGEVTLTLSDQHDKKMERIDRMYAKRARLAAFRRTLCPVTARVFDVRMSPPIELLVIARNIVGRTVSAKARMPNQALALYLNLDVGVVAKAARELREAFDKHFKVAQ